MRGLKSRMRLGIPGLCVPSGPGGEGLVAALEDAAGDLGDGRVVHAAAGEDGSPAGGGVEGEDQSGVA